jgi:hypothetical protein
MKPYGGVDVYIHIPLISVLVGGEWSASYPCHFTPGERAPSTLCTGCVGPKTSLDDVRKKKSLSNRDSNSDSSVVQSVASRYTDSLEEPYLLKLNQN